jgi:hypothetical protein
LKLFLSAGLHCGECDSFLADHPSPFLYETRCGVCARYEKYQRSIATDAACEDVCPDFKAGPCARGDICPLRHLAEPLNEVKARQLFMTKSSFGDCLKAVEEATEQPMQHLFHTQKIPIQQDDNYTLGRYRCSCYRRPSPDALKQALGKEEDGSILTPAAPRQTLKPWTKKLGCNCTIEIRGSADKFHVSIRSCHDVRCGTTRIRKRINAAGANE